MKEIQSKEKVKSQRKKSYMKNYSWGWGGSQRLLTVIMFFESINRSINHHCIAEPSEASKDRALRSVHDILPLARAAGWREAVFVKGSRWNLKLASLSPRHPAQGRAVEWTNVTCKPVPRFLEIVQYVRNSHKLHEDFHL